MSRSAAARRPSKAVRVAAPLAAAALVVSAGAGFAAGFSSAESSPKPTVGRGAFVSWVEGSVDRGVEQVTAAMAKHQLRSRGESVLGASASLTGVPFRSLHLTLAKSAEPTAAEARKGVFRAQAIVEYRLRVDDVRVGRRADAVFRLKDGQWRLVRVAPSGLDLWDHEPVQSVRNGRVLVIGPSGDPRIDALGATAESARADVAAFWDAKWPETAVVVLPSSSRLLNPLLGVNSGSDQVAVTRWESGQDGPIVRVLVNPTYYDRMPPLAREIVLRHEITHVAQDALPQGGTPSWLSEGLAEYVGYRGSGVPFSYIGTRLFEQVRAGEVPEQLPADSDFDFARTQEERRMAYESGWSFCQMIADRYGEQKLVPFYVAVAKGDGLEQDRLNDAAEKTVGASFDELVDQWRSWLDANA
ncbi:MAG: hypothetical protein ACJ73J_05290 [Actinomycetes bacterium]